MRESIFLESSERSGQLRELQRQSGIVIRPKRSMFHNIPSHSGRVDI